MEDSANRETTEQIRKAFESGDVGDFARLAAETSSDDFVREWPQSGERIRGRENDRKILEGYGAATGAAPKITPRRLLTGGNLVITEATADYGDRTPVSVVGIYELKDGKVTKATEYFANPFAAPGWRTPFVERMDR